jgi:ribulose-phosphate 3-epimerase
MTVRIAPSLLSANWARLTEAVAICEAGGADWIHLDVMDGCFVPNLTFGARFIETVRGLTKLPLDVHMMVIEPEKYFEDFVRAGATGLTIHAAAGLDTLLIMSVDPGFGGQHFIPHSLDKLSRARGMLSAAGSQALLEVDGGINRDTITACWRAGADTFVAGNAVFSARDPAAEIGALRERCQVTV